MSSIFRTLIAVAGLAFGSVFFTALFAHAAPLPQPKLGATCPIGYEASGSYCIPNANTRCRAMPKIDATCPIGFTSSGGDYCIETGCQSR